MTFNNLDNYLSPLTSNSYLSHQEVIIKSLTIIYFQVFMCLKYKVLIMILNCNKIKIQLFNFLLKDPKKMVFFFN